MNKDSNFLLQAILNNTTSSDVSAIIRRLIALHCRIDQKIGENELFVSNVPEMADLQAETAEKRDYRILEVTFNNFRSVPNDGEIPFGIKFHDDDSDTPCSLFLLGQNSSGKTTIFSALERHYSATTSLATEKDLDARRILTYGFGEIKGKEPEKTSLTIRTISDTEVHTEGIDKTDAYCSPSPFCSEYDIMQLGINGADLFNYVLKQLGFDEIMALRSSLNDIKKDIDKSLSNNDEGGNLDLSISDVDEIIQYLLNNYSHVINSKSTAKNFLALKERDVESIKNGKDPTYFKTLWSKTTLGQKKKKTTDDPMINLRKESNTRENIENKAEKKLDYMYDRLIKCLKSVAEAPDKKKRFTEILEELVKEKDTIANDVGGRIHEDDKKDRINESKSLKIIIEEIDKKLVQVIDRFKKEHFSMLRDILNIFSNNDGDMYIDPDVSTRELVIRVKGKHEEKDAFNPTPQEYFNTFRFKLYVVSFKISLAFLEMKLKKVRVPVVIDDVFNASDFENNIRLEYFVRNIYTAYDKLGLEEPLQLIMLTHDNMVLEAFRKGVEQTDLYEGIKHLKRPFICGRLYRYNVAKQMSKDLGENTPRFYNLYLKTN